MASRFGGLVDTRLHLTATTSMGSIRPFSTNAWPFFLMGVYLQKGSKLPSSATALTWPGMTTCGLPSSLWLADHCN